MQTPPSLPLKKPKTFMLVGVALLVLGIFYVLGLLMNIIMAAVPVMREQNAALKLLDTDPSYVPVYYTGLFLNGGLGLLAICAGIGLIKCKNWGRQLGIGWAALTILTTPLGLWITNKYVLPATQAEVQKQMEATGGSGAASGEIVLAIAKATTIGFLVFWVVFCIVLIIFLVRPKMKAWCSLQETQTQGGG
jgi:hypothetical protein